MKTQSCRAPLLRILLVTVLGVLAFFAAVIAPDVRADGGEGTEPLTVCDSTNSVTPPDTLTVAAPSIIDPGSADAASLLFWLMSLL